MFAQAFKESKLIRPMMSSLWERGCVDVSGTRTISFSKNKLKIKKYIYIYIEMRESKRDKKKGGNKRIDAPQL